MNVKDLIVRQPAEDIAEAFLNRLGLEEERREAAMQRITEFIMAFRDIEPCETGHLLIGIYHFDDDGEFLDPCLYAREALHAEFEPESELSQLKNLAEIDALDEKEADRLAHCKAGPESYSFMLSPWNEILGYEVEPRNVKEVGAAALCAEILYEMTFFGFDEAAIEAERQKLHESIREFEEISRLPEEEQKKLFVPAEEMFAHFGIPGRTEEEEEADHRRLCRKVLANKVRTHQALQRYGFGNGDKE